MNWCWLRGHKWKIVGVFNGKVEGYTVCVVVSKCARCNKIRQEQIDGHWDLEQLNN
jgi:hypothetical protein